MQIRPIRTDADHEAAVRRVAELMSASPGTPEADELEVLAVLIDGYEQRHWPIPLPDPISAILFRMEQQGLTRKDLEPMLGSRARVSEVLSGRRSLTLGMIQKLHGSLGIPADILIGMPVKAPFNAQMKPTRTLQRAA